jgi:hypothetical protein
MSLGFMFFGQNAGSLFSSNFSKKKEVTKVVGNVRLTPYRSLNTFWVSLDEIKYLRHIGDLLDVHSFDKNITCCSFNTL